MKIRITELFKDYKFEMKGKDKKINDICYDSRLCKENSIFFAIKGENVDGHQFIDDAINNGAGAVVVENEILIDHNNITLVKVKDTKDALAFASKNFFANPSEKLTLIGITGTNGKTTITYLLERILKECGIIGTINYRLKDKIYEANNTTPLPFELNRFLKECVDENVKFVVMEVSSHGVELKRIKYLDFSCGVFTNLSHEHLDFHKNMKNYFNAKKRFFSEILFQSKKKKKFAVINIDDEYGKKILGEISDKLITISNGKKSKGKIYNENYKNSINGIKANINTSYGKIKISTNLIGEFNLYNILATIAVGIGLGIDVKKIENSLNGEVIIPGRLEKPLKNKNYFVDYAHTPDALENVLKTLNKIKDGRKIITVFGCGGDRDKLKRPLMGYIAAKFSDFVVITSDNPRTEDPFLIIEDILKGVEKAVKENLIKENQYRIIPDRKDAILMGIRACKNGDILLVAGKGHEDYQIIGKEKIYFSDKDVILEGIGENVHN